MNQPQPTTTLQVDWRELVDVVVDDVAVDDVDVDDEDVGDVVVGDVVVLNQDTIFHRFRHHIHCNFTSRLPQPHSPNILVCHKFTACFSHLWNLAEDVQHNWH